MSGSDDELPAWVTSFSPPVGKKQVEPLPVGKTKGRQIIIDDSSDDDAPLAARAGPSQTAAAAAAPAGPSAGSQLGTIPEDAPAAGVKRSAPGSDSAAAGPSRPSQPTSQDKGGEEPGVGARSPPASVTKAARRGEAGAGAGAGAAGRAAAASPAARKKKEEKTEGGAAGPSAVEVEAGPSAAAPEASARAVGAGGERAPPPGDPLAKGDLALMLPDKMPNTKVLLELRSTDATSHATDLGGDSGSVGRLVAVKKEGGDEFKVDLKGILYNTTVLPLAGTAMVISIGGNDTAKVECVMHDFVRLQEEYLLGMEALEGNLADWDGSDDEVYRDAEGGETGGGGGGDGEGKKRKSGSKQPAGGTKKPKVSASRAIGAGRASGGVKKPRVKKAPGAGAKKVVAKKAAPAKDKPAANDKPAVAKAAKPKAAPKAKPPAKKKKGSESEDEADDDTDEEDNDSDFQA
ncbi:hypothetical protein FOA52_015338 [Chlamydomonas sp. UWO 241]|nr:hypothetical protein FOA52_015338 [Chlamydomonas sp. UWO 241]